MIRCKKGIGLALFFVGFALHANTAHAVIPQLLGPLSALLSILPQILAFVGIALLAIFKPATYRLVFSYARDFAVKYKAVAAVIGVAIVGGLAWLTYDAFQPKQTTVQATVKPTALTGSDSARSSQAAWPGFRGGAARTGHADSVPGPKEASLAWIFEERDALLADFSSSPTVVGDRVYISGAKGSVFSSGGTVYCLDANTGERIWQYPSPIQMFSSPTVVDGRVYVGEGFHQDTDCSLHCIDAATGNSIWDFQTKSHVESSAFVSQGKVYFGAGDDGVYCVDAVDGAEIWHYADIHVDASPLVWNGVVYFGTGYGSYRVYAVDAYTGEELWAEAVDSPVWGSPCAHENLVFFGLGNGNFLESAANPTGGVVAFNARTGKQAWDYEVGDAVLTAVAYRDGFVYFGSRDGHLYALNAEAGELRWKSPIGSAVVSSPAVTESAVYVGANNGYLYSININDGQPLWQFDTSLVANGEPIFSSPAIANGRLYVGSKDRYVLCLGEKITPSAPLQIEDR